MGVNGSDNHLREVQRTLRRDFADMTIMSTLGVRPPGVNGDDIFVNDAFKVRAGLHRDDSVLATGDAAP